MVFGQFVGELNKIGNTINLLSDVPLRTTAAMIARAACVVTLDTGILYVAQGLRIPAVSLWGTHAPQTRLMYDKAYLDLAIWNQKACPSAPCFAYACFPAHKCLRGGLQHICEPLSAIKPSDIIAKVTEAEGRR